VTGGNATVGTISTSGLYTAPSVVPNPAAVTVTAIASADTTKSAKATVTDTDPVYTTVTLLAPNGGEVLVSGGTFTIRWGAPVAATNFKLTYSLNSGTTWQAITSSNVTGKSTVWKVPAVAATKTTCLVKVVGYDARNKQVGVDQSDKPFAIKK